jgi:hypothetical protein
VQRRQQRITLLRLHRTSFFLSAVVVDEEDFVEEKKEPLYHELRKEQIGTNIPNAIESIFVVVEEEGAMRGRGGGSWVGVLNFPPPTCT